MRQVRAAKAEGGVLVLDTLSRAAPGIDENAGKDMGECIAAAKELQSELGGLLLLVHHGGKDEARGMRGHSSLIGAVDACIKLTRRGEERRWVIEKAKDAQDGIGSAFELQPVFLGADDEGENITSCVVLPVTDAAPPIDEAAKASGKHQTKALEVVRATLTGKPAMPLAELQGIVAAALDVKDAKRRPERARKAISGLLGMGLLVKGEDDAVSLPACTSTPSDADTP